MKIGVLGLGYVGIVNVACFSKAGYKVTCSDVKSQKVSQVKNGKSPILEPEVNSLLSEGVKSGNIIATENAKEVIENSDLVIVCVGTPSKADGEINLSYLNNIVLEISSYLNVNDKKFIAFRSTVPPGTTEFICNKYFGDKFPNVIPVFYPEFLREGSAVNDFYNYGRLVIGKPEKSEISELITILHLNLEAPVYIVDLKTAEYSKYIDNSFHALKVTFANEIFGLGNELGVDVKLAHEIFISDTKLNISKLYLKPGLPFGGSCLPKDLRELQYLIGKSKREMNLLKSLIPSNDNFLNELYLKIIEQNARKIAFIGVTFKNYSDDLRESPILKIYDKIELDKNYQIMMWDEDFNKENIRIEFPHLFSIITDFDKIILEAELIIVSKRFLKLVLEKRNLNQRVINISDEQSIKHVENLVNLYN